MAVEEKVEVEGEVTEALPNLMFRVKLDTGHEGLGKLAGRLRRYRIRVLPGDRVRVELSPYDLSRGRVTYRMKQAPGPEGRGVRPDHSASTRRPRSGSPPSCGRSGA